MESSILSFRLKASDMNCWELLIKDFNLNPFVLFYQFSSSFDYFLSCSTFIGLLRPDSSLKRSIIHPLYGALEFSFFTVQVFVIISHLISRNAVMSLREECLSILLCLKWGDAAWSCKGKSSSHVGQHKFGSSFIHEL